MCLREKRKGEKRAKEKRNIDGLVLTLAEAGLGGVDLDLDDELAQVMMVLEQVMMLLLRALS